MSETSQFVKELCDPLVSASIFHIKKVFINIFPPEALQFPALDTSLRKIYIKRVEF